MRRPKSREFKLQHRLSESEEIEQLEAWIESGKPDFGSNPLSLSPPPKNSRIGKLLDGSFSPYAGADKFFQLPISKKTKDGLKASNYTKMTDIQRASLPHSLCGRDILGAAKTGSGKTLAFVIPVLEILYRARWEPAAGIGCIIMSPARELADQLFEVLKSVGRFHGFSIGLLIGGRKDVDTEKQLVNELNILVCTPGRLLQHMDETPNFECSQLQVLVLDEADRILDTGFKRELNAIISQLPKHRQTLLFSATQTRSVKDLARLSLRNDPEYISVHEESTTATPSLLEQKAVIIPVDRKLDVLWSFIKANLKSRILVFLTSCKQVKFVYEAFKKLRPGIPLKCLHGRMKQDRRMAIYAKFCEKRSVLFSTDVASRGLDFNKNVEWVVQVDCPDDVASYIHRVGRTARYDSKGKSVLFLAPSEMKMLDKLQEKKIPIKCIKDFLSKGNKKLQPVSGLLAALLVKYPNLQQLAQRAFITYLRSIYKKHDKEVFDVSKLPIDEFSASFGLPMTPNVRFLKQGKGEKVSEEVIIVQDNNAVIKRPFESLKVSSESDVGKSNKAELLPEEDFLQEKDTEHADQEDTINIGDAMPATRVLKKKKLKINVHRPLGTRVVFDDVGNSLPPLAKLAIHTDDESLRLDLDKVSQRYAELREAMKLADKEDKALDRQRRKEKRIKEKMKLKRGRDEEEEEDGDRTSEEDDDEITTTKRVGKKSKIKFDSDSDSDQKKDEKIIGLGSDGNAITLAEQEELALQLLSSMHS